MSQHQARLDSGIAPLLMSARRWIGARRAAQPVGGGMVSASDEAQNKADDGARKRAEESDEHGASEAGDLSRRIELARAAMEPESSRNVVEKYAFATLAWRMTIELVAGCVIGFGMGWGLDALLGAAPVFMVIFGLFGFAAGVKTVMETAREAQSAAAPRVDEE